MRGCRRAIFSASSRWRLGSSRKRSQCATWKLIQSATSAMRNWSRLRSASLQDCEELASGRTMQSRSSRRTCRKRSRWFWVRCAPASPRRSTITWSRSRLLPLSMPLRHARSLYAGPWKGYRCGESSRRCAPRFARVPKCCASGLIPAMHRCGHWKACYRLRRSLERRDAPTSTSRSFIPAARPACRSSRPSARAIWPPQRCSRRSATAISPPTA